MEDNEFDKVLNVALSIRNLRQDLLVNFQTHDGQNPKRKLFYSIRTKGLSKLNSQMFDLV